MPDISIVIPIYNVADYISECLKSVISQDADCAIECILVDDRGFDNSLNIAHELISNYNGPVDFRIIVRSANGGLSAARNSGIHAAKGKYIYFLDSDDVITPDCISSLYKCATTYPDAQIITGDFQTFPQEDIYRAISLKDKSFPKYSNDINWIRSIFLTGFPITAWNKLIRRDFILDNNLFFKEGILHEDNHWQAIAYHKIQSVAFVDKVTYLYRLRSGSITMSENAALLKVHNLGLIYKDVFSHQAEWDLPWVEWAYSSLRQLRFSPEFFCYSSATRKILKHSSWTIFNNKSCPLTLRIMFLYLSFPRILFSGRLLSHLYKKSLQKHS